MAPRNDLLLRALRREPVAHTPVWIMRQAGRYLPEYRETRRQAGDFLTLCKTPELACEVTLQPLRRFALDAAILFSDILTIPDAMGLGLSFNEGEGPRIARPVRTASAARALGAPDPDTDLRYVMDAVRTIRGELDGRLPLIGFAGSPWTLATYMVEGGSSRDFRHTKSMLYGAPQTAERLLSTLAESVSLYLRAQVAAGVDVVMIFDTWGGVLSERHYHRFSLAYMQRIVADIAAATPQVPVILFTKGGGQWLETIAASGCAGVGLDWTVNLGEARRRVGTRVALQGNLDPAALHAPPEQIVAAVGEVLADYGPGPGHVFNLGHGIDQHVDPERVAVLVDAVHSISGERHRAHGDGQG